MEGEQEEEGPLINKRNKRSLRDFSIMAGTQPPLAPIKSGLAHPASSTHIWKNTEKVTEDGAFLWAKKGTRDLGRKEERSTSDFQLF